ncbi:hypothetical protein D7030_04745 [Flavobacteriaceae bacterium AU392]|nr:hypothetical protein D1817_11220 [Flavobacteriaceae bacterium]RKM85984.1 hypothetical protein D7030_04745 [Flavobacteriaceae bacterium AU392]
MHQIKLIIILFLVVISSSYSQNKNVKSISRDGVFTTQVKNVTIEGQLFLPEGEGAFPVLIVVSGSDNSTREGLKSFAQFFNSFGYGLYIYDKRGIGGSTGTYPLETLENPNDFLSARADDIISIVNLLKTHTKIKTSKIGLFGSSQGTWVSTIVYDKISDDIGLLIMSSGGVTSTRAEQYYEDLIEKSELSITDANQKIYDYKGDLGYNPKPTLEKTIIPTLFIYGDKDDSHPTHYDKDIVEGMKKSNFTIHFYENANHNLLDVNTQSFPKSLFPQLSNWLISHK